MSTSDWDRDDADQEGRGPSGADDLATRGQLIRWFWREVHDHVTADDFSSRSAAESIHAFRNMLAEEGDVGDALYNRGAKHVASLVAAHARRQDLAS